MAPSPIPHTVTVRPERGRVAATVADALSTENRSAGPSPGSGATVTS